MWFLVGLFCSPMALRPDATCTIPRGKYILFPIANATWIQTPQDEEAHPEYTETD